jgi:PAS domain S-box-containing protein
MASGGFDWSATPLGPQERWSDDLRVAVAAALSRPAAPVSAPGPADVAGPADAGIEDGADPLTPAVILDALFGAAPLGIGVWDRDLRFVRVNATLAAMNGVPEEHHAGRLPAEVLPDIRSLDAVMDRWRHILSTGEPWLDVELRGRTPAAPDEERIWNEQFFPIRAGADIVGIGAVVAEVTEPRRIEEALRSSEAMFRQFAAASSDILWVRNTSTDEFEYLSPAVAKLFGESVSMTAGRGGTYNWLDGIVPEDRETAAGTLTQVRQGRSVVHDYRMRIPGSGKIRWIRNTAFPLRDDQGVIRRIGGIVQDVTDERDAAQRLTVLIGELQHRTRNVMGVVQAMVETTLAASTGLDDFADTFGARMATLARVQNLLTRLDGLDRISFDELLHCELGTVGALPADDPRVSLDGPERVPLRSGGIQTLALAIHELMTNSLKYGALSQPDARLHIRWRMEPPKVDDRARLHIDWRETGVAMRAGAADRVGQGRELIEYALPYQLHADTGFTLTEDGVHCTIVLPVSHAVDRATAS